jgi:hypothetical protein
MDKKYYLNLLLILLASATILLSCRKDTDPVIDDFFLMYDIPQVPLEKDLTIGAYYKSFTWNNNVKQVPSLGKYVSGNAAIYNQHIELAGKAGIDYFIFDLRSKFNASNYNTDIAFINQLLAADAAGAMKFAFYYNFGSMALADNNRIEKKAGCLDRMRNDFKEMVPFFQRANYMKINGAAVVIIKDAHNLFADDNAAVFQTLRNDVKALGADLYLVGEQIAWTPPARYDFRFKSGIDAITHTRYVDIPNVQYERYIKFPQMFDQALHYSSEYFKGWGVNYVPCISPSFSRKITTPANTNFVINKDEKWFRDVCNVAKRSCTSEMVIIDSFNDWNFDTQIEPAQDYGEKYLEIIHSAFKKY